jgi:hypothetical protein
MRHTFKTRTIAEQFRLAAHVAVIVLLMSLRLEAQQPGQKTFDSPGEAAAALFLAAKAGDTNQLMQVFGPEAQPLLSSGDEVADSNDRKRIVEKYEQMRRLVREPDKTVTLYLGAENWPFPIPLISKNGRWFFDTPAGKTEILFRRIGRNEYTTMETLDVLAEAQKEYVSEPRDGVRQYAQKILSDEGVRNGLYWKTAPGEPLSPIGPLIAEAAEQGYARKEGRAVPFHGYVYRVLHRQGGHAPCGSKDYIVDGKMTRGFAFLAYPAEYRNSGVMTFIVGMDGQIYQKDLGEGTAELAASIEEFDPDSSWTAVE